MPSSGRDLISPFFACEYGLLVLICIVSLLFFGRAIRRGSLCELDMCSDNVPAPTEPELSLRSDRRTPRVASPSSETPTTEQQEALRQGMKQPFEAFLVLDVEGTCTENTRFDYPNEIIEWPVCLLRWKDMNKEGLARELRIVDEFRSFVKPTWRPKLSQFCKDLTGIAQEQVDNAPTFTVLLDSFRSFLEKHGLIEPVTGRRLIRYCWCSDGPFDIRDFVVKQCFISKVQIPAWLAGNVLDVRLIVRMMHAADQRKVSCNTKRTDGKAFPLPTRMALTIPRQLQLLGLAPFEGRQHCGIDDTRNITRIIIELARRGARLEPNTSINPNRRWPWMGKRGKILDGYH